MRESILQREAPVRTFVCTECGGSWDEEHLSGRHPTVCPTCSPDGSQKRAHAREARRRPHRRIAELERELALVKWQLAAALRESAQDFSLYPTAGRAEVAAAVRDVARAQGIKETRDALLGLSTAARAWAAILGVGPRKAANIERGLDDSLQRALALAAEHTPHVWASDSSHLTGVAVAGMAE